MSVESLIEKLKSVNKANISHADWDAIIYQIIAEGERAVPALIHALSLVSGQKRSEIAFALGNIGNKKAVPALLDLLDDDSETVRTDALYALGKIGDPATIPAIAAAFLDDDEHVQSAAAIALGNIHHDDSVQALTAVLGQSGRVHGYAKFALGQLGNRSLQPLLDYLEVVTDEWLHDEIVDTLYRIETPEARAAIERLRKHL